MRNKILVIPKGFLGDALLTTPVFAALHRLHPGATISVLCSPALAEFVRRDPLVHHVVVYDRRAAHKGWGGLKALANVLRDAQYDVAYSFQRSPRTAFLLWRAGIRERVGFDDSYLSWLYSRRVSKRRDEHEVLRNLSLVFAGEVADERSELGELRSRESKTDVGWADLRVPVVVEERLSSRVREILSPANEYILLSPGSAWETKRWSAEGFRGVAATYAERGVRVIVVGAEQDREACAHVSRGLNVVNLCGETSVEDIIALVKGALCVVCNDSLALHIGSATKTPVVAVFCSTSPKFGFGPWRNRAVVVEKQDLFCKPCRRHGSKRCPTGTRMCMTGVDVREVICAVDGFLGEQGRQGAALRVLP